MPEKNGGDPQPSAGDPQTQPNAGEPQKTSDAGQGEPKADERDGLLDKLRRNEKQLLKQVGDLQTKLKEHEDAKLSETERLQGRVRELEDENTGLKEKITTAGLRDAARASAAKAGATRPDAVVRLIDLAAVRRDDDGNPANLDELIEQAKKETPELFGPSRPGSADAGARGNTNGGADGDMNQLIRRAAGRT